ncbi:MAG: CSLREA domain-containing protein, partial [Pseudomonadota bacterium]
MLCAVLCCIPFAALASSIQVTTTLDESDGSCSDGDCSIRDALAIAQDGDLILVPAGHYVLNGSALIPTSSVTIIGAGPQETLIDADGQSQVFIFVPNLGGSLAVDLS